MNSYSMGELEEGKTKSDFNIVVTEQMMDTFRQLSGNNNPLHTDQKYARSKGMKEKTVYGMLVASFYSKLVGMYLPGKFCMLHEIKINFRKPVYPGDMLHVSGVIKEKRELFHRAVIDAEISNQNKEKVSNARITVGVLDEV